MVSRATAETFLQTVIRPACEAIGLWSPEAGQLILATFIHESHLVERRQIGGGPALGLGQMEPETHDDCYTNYLDFRPQLRAKVLAVAGLAQKPDAEWLVAHDQYAAAMARVKYLRTDAPLPSINNIPEMANYWSIYYNTRNELAKIQQFISNWHLVMEN
jgi:hypothetical protein